MTQKTKKSPSTDIKLKPLSPTLRTKKRFIKVKIVSDKKFDFKQVSESLIEQIISYMGSVDFSKAGIWILRDKFDFDNQLMILKCSVKNKEKLIAILTLFYEIEKNSVKLEVLKVSGTLKGLENN